MSASDLAPRIVLVVTDDLEQENVEIKSQLKEQEDNQLLVQITGPNGTPIHSKVQLKMDSMVPLFNMMIVDLEQEWGKLLFTRRRNPPR